MVAIFASRHTTNFGYPAVYGNLNISAQDGPSSLQQKLIARACYKVHGRVNILHILVPLT